MYQTNQPVNNNANAQQNYQGQGQTFQQTQPNQQFNQGSVNQQFNQGNPNQQYQQNRNINFQQNPYGYGVNNTPQKQYTGLLLPSVIIAGVAALLIIICLGDVTFMDRNTWVAEFGAGAAISLTVSGILALLGWQKQNRWLVLAAFISSAIGIIFISFTAIATFILQLIAFIKMTKDSKKQTNFY